MATKKRLRNTGLQNKILFSFYKAPFWGVALAPKSSGCAIAIVSSPTFLRENPLLGSKPIRFAKRDRKETEGARDGARVESLAFSPKFSMLPVNISRAFPAGGATPRAF